MQPLWISRHFDSIYSVAITEQAVYLGGHFGFIESPESCPTEPCYPGLENVGYGTGQGLAGYGLGDAVVRRDHLAALEPDHGSGARVVLGLELLRGRQGHGGHLARPVRRRRRHVQGRCPHRPGRRSTTSTPRPSRRRRPTPRSPPRSRAGSSRTARRSRSRAPRGSPPAPSAGSRCRSRTATATSGCRTTAPRSPHFGGTTNTLNATLGAGHGHDAHLVDHGPGHEHHHQPQPAGLRPGLHRRHGWHRRLDQGGEVVRVVQHRRTRRRRPRITGPSGTQTVDDVHDDRHRQRRQGRQLAELLVPRRAAALPPARRQRGRHLQHLPRRRPT